MLRLEHLAFPLVCLPTLSATERLGGLDERDHLFDRAHCSDNGHSVIPRLALERSGGGCHHGD
jgi:hypothetical protein